MASPVEDLIDAINDDDSTRVAELVTGDPSLASSRDRNGVSAIMLSRYRFDRETTDALLAADPDLDVFEATALGYIDRLRERLAEDHWRATAYSTDGFTALHFAAFFGKVEAARTLLDAGAVVNAYSVNELQVQPLHSAASGRHHEVCRVLIAAGADVNATQRHEFTPSTRRRSTAMPSSSSCSCRPGRTRRLGPRRATPRPTPPRRPATSTSRVDYARSPPSDQGGPARASSRQPRSRYRSRSHGWTIES